MLYLAHSVIYLVWIVYIVKKYKYPLQAIIGAYFFFLLICCIPEVFFTSFFDFYKFSIQLPFNSRIHNSFPLVLADGIILPFTGLLLLHYAIQVKKLWLISFIFTSIYGILEWLYIHYGYLTYQKWNIWISVSLYFFASRILMSYAHRILLYDPPLPYTIRIAAAAYHLPGYFGAYLGGSIFALYQWRPFIDNHAGDDDTLSLTVFNLMFTVLSAAIIPRINPKYKSAAFMSFAVLTIALSYYAYSRGWLIYYTWNHVLTALYWLTTFTAFIFYDRWETKFANSKLAAS